MRHRIVSGMGLGNPDEVLLENKGQINKEFADDAIASYFEDEEGFDFQVEEDSVTIGIEPAYQYDKLKIVQINKDKSKSYIQRGKAWGPYGSQIAKNTTVYGDYRKRSKFVKFVDKWHEVLFGSGT
jgi:hypothetical protein